MQQRILENDVVEAMKKGDVSTLKTYLESQNNPNAVNAFFITEKYQNYTPLMIAAKFGQREIIEYLLNQSGIKIHIRNHHDETAYSIAKENNFDDIHKQILTLNGRLEHIYPFPLTPVNISVFELCQNDTSVNLNILMGSVNMIDINNYNPPRENNFIQLTQPASLLNFDSLDRHYLSNSIAISLNANYGNIIFPNEQKSDSQKLAEKQELEKLQDEMFANSTLKITSTNPSSIFSKAPENSHKDNDNVESNKPKGPSSGS